MLKRAIAIFAFVVLALIISLAAVAEALPAGAPRSGRFTVLTYNVAGLPQGISQSQPLFYMSKISPLLNAYELVLTQEDFFYGKRLKSRTTHPYYAGRSRGKSLGDGLSRFSVFPLGAAEHVAWSKCYGTFGHANDCLTPKGFAFAVHELAPGVKVHVYDLHMDAGGSPGDIAARAAGMEQLIAYLNEHSAGQAVIIGGDFNISPKRPNDLATLQKLLDTQHLTNACVAMSCPKDRIDRILFRGSGQLELTAGSYQVEKERFASTLGLPLSDHYPVAVGFEWRQRN
jgi:endonuclease/exonuclease/phosphatase (EEP) superfamily protein YafD